MQLTNPALPWLLGILAFAVFVVLLIEWPRWSSRSAQVVTRGVQIVLINVLVLATAGVIVNNQQVLYSSWADLFGVRGSATVGHHGASGASAGRSQVTGPGLADPSGPRDFALPQPGNRLQQYVVHDNASNMDMQVLAYLPVGYNPASNRTYPVILGLAGWPGVPARFTQINFDSTIDQLTAEHKLHPSIVVIPQVNNPRTVDTECVNGPPGSPQTETWLTKEVPNWVLTHLHAQTSRQSWATLGYSFGGWCAAMLTMHHPAVFGAAISFAGYFRPTFDSSYHPLTPAQMSSYDLVEQMKTGPPAVAIWLFASQQDPLAYPSSRAFYQAAQPPAAVKATFVQVGGHRHQVYEPYTASALTWLAATLPGFAP